MSKNYLFFWITIVIWHSSAMNSYTDEYYYKDILVGERAAGLGGAYVGVSDDPSGIYHNPAGILFSQENYFSLSTNAYTRGTRRFQEILAGKDYTYSSQDLSPVFFGFTQSIRKAKFGFAIVVPDAASSDQNDTISYEATVAPKERKLTRNFLRQDITYLVGPAYAMELANNLSIGIAFMGLLRREKLIDNTSILFEPVGTGQYFTYMAQATSTFYGAVTKFGLQYMPRPKWSLGLVLSWNGSFLGSGWAQLVKTKTGSNGLPGQPSGKADNDIEVKAWDLETEVPRTLGLSAGIAYFPSKSFLISTQVDLHGPQADYQRFPIKTTYNWAAGVENFFSHWLAGRIGVFSNNAKTEPIDPANFNQPPHINLMGVSAGLSLYRAATSLTLTGVYAFGLGEGQAINGQTGINKVSEERIQFYFSGSYQM